jgi:uncharacterized membrane protein YjjB (DUF3815 family)
MTYSILSMIVYAYGWMSDQRALDHCGHNPGISWFAFIAAAIVSFLAGSFPIH